ncbi:integral membrane protein protein [Babesia ovis]|uniref:Integral membrane protein protein n=1 Tax=Babesia ovis TaxID=5869 RepID=A0A9W5TCZ8_BABOV|nr:integral membrane protein protein [Babesia ovis]
MCAQFMQAGFGIASYLQSALSPVPMRGGNGPGDFDQPLDRPSQPPAMVRSLIDASRVYFRLSHQNAVHNLLCLFAPVGKVRHLVPDLYIPAVALYTFLLLRSVYISMVSEARYHLNDAIARTLTRMSFIFALEFILLSGLVYATQPSAPSLDEISQQSQPRHSQGSGTLGDQQNSYTYPGNDGISPYGMSGVPTGQMGYGMYQSQYGLETTQNDAVPFGKRSGSRTNMTEFQGATKYFGEDMTMPLSGRPAIRIAQKIVIIGYKYVLLNCYILVMLVAPIRGVSLPMAVYVGLCSLLFSLRMIVSLNSGGNDKQNPLMFIFPFLQPVFCYFLLPKA